MQRQRASPRAQGAGARGCGPRCPPLVPRKSPASGEPQFAVCLQIRPFLFDFLLGVCWLFSFFGPRVPGRGPRGAGESEECLRSRAFNSTALARLAGCVPCSWGFVHEGTSAGRLAVSVWVCCGRSRSARYNCNRSAQILSPQSPESNRGPHPRAHTAALPLHKPMHQGT